MLSRKLIVAGVAAAISMCPMAGRAQNAGTSLDVNEGLWDFTLTVHAISQWPPEVLAPYTPEQRAQMLASLKAAQDKGTVQTREMCLTRTQLDSATFLDNDPNCTHENSMEGGTLVRRSQCNATTIESRYTPVNKGSFKGYQNADMHNASSQHMNIDVAAKWAGADCAAVEKQRIYQEGVAAGVDKDVMTFLPYFRPNGDGTVNLRGFGRNFVYTYQPGNNWPTVGYQGGIAGGPAGQVPDVWFGGTDGNFIYITVPNGGGICGADTLTVRVDHSGNATRIDKMPSNLRGGRGPNCG